MSEFYDFGAPFGEDLISYDELGKLVWRQSDGSYRIDIRCSGHCYLDTNRDDGDIVEFHVWPRVREVLRLQSYLLIYTD